MQELDPVLGTAWELLRGLDPELASIVALSLWVSGTAVLLAAIIGLPLGAWIAISRFPGRSLLVATLNAMMGLPPVVVGLCLYVLLSRAGPLGELGLLFTPHAMVGVQCALVTPIIAALTCQTIADLKQEYGELLSSLDVHAMRAIATLLWDGRFSLATAVLAGFGRASAEVGGILIVGGNIRGVTRVMTTTIALETSKGRLELALALGVILIAIILVINAAAEFLRRLAEPVSP